LDAVASARYTMSSNETVLSLLRVKMNVPIAEMAKFAFGFSVSSCSVYSAFEGENIASNLLRTEARYVPLKLKLLTTERGLPLRIFVVSTCHEQSGYRSTTDLKYELISCRGTTQFPTFGFSVNDYSFEGAGGSGIVSSHGSASDLSIYGATTSATTNDSPTPQGTAGSKTASPVPDGDAEVLGFINSILLPLGEGDFEALDAAVSRVCASDCILRTQKLKSGSSPTVDKVVPRQEISSYFKSVVDRYPDCSWHVETTKIRKGKPRSVVSSFNFKGTYLASVRNKFDAIFSPSNAEYTEQLLTENPNANLAISAIGTFILTLNKDRTVSLLDIVYLAEATASKCDD
jgi:hypothetical protein